MNPERSEYETHHGWAINVKDHAGYDSTLDPDDVLSDYTLQAMFDTHAEWFWNDASELAVEHGFQKIWSAGRMGGWAVVDPQPNDDDWELGDPERLEFIERMKALETDLREAMDYHREELREDIREKVRLAKAEPGEAAYWAARDVLTVERLWQ